MKILIVDDELMIRAKLKYILDTEMKSHTLKEGFSICAEATNGIQAFQLVEKLHPDIVISDMKMPEMDGLELCDRCHKEYPEILFIALSNYDDFEFVKGTLLNGAVDYIMKHTLDAEHLHAALAKACEQRKDRRSRQELPEGSLDSLRADFAVNLLSGVYKNEKQIGRILKSLDIPLGTKQIVPVEMRIQDYKYTTLDEKTLLTFSVINIITEIMIEQKNGVICHLEGGKYVFLFSFEDMKSEQKIRELLNGFLNRIRFSMKKLLELNVYFLIGRIQGTVLTVHQEYKKIDKQYMTNLYVERDLWISSEEEKNDLVTPDFFYDTELDKNLRTAILNGSREEAHKLIDGVFDSFFRDKPSEAVLKIVVVNILAAIEKVCKDCGIQTEIIYRQAVSNKEIMEMHSFSRISEAINKILDSVFEQLSSQQTVELTPYMKRAVAYIHKHYKENISQAEVAEAVGISSAYLSTLFRKEMKESFPSFLMDVRLKYAVYLLEEDRLSLKEIADKCGFTDYIYFLKSFKKKFRCSPKEYKTGMNKNES